MLSSSSDPLQVQLGEPEDHPPGLILPNGEINWNCPCLGGMAIGKLRQYKGDILTAIIPGPCGIEFREAFSCFHYSEVCHLFQRVSLVNYLSWQAEPKGSDCLEQFAGMQR